MGRIRLMLADDEAPLLEAMRELVSTDQFIDVIGTARDASEAIHLAELHAPDVALLDVRMPGGGSHAARENPPAFTPDQRRRLVGEHGSENRRIDGSCRRRGIRGQGPVGR